MMTQSLASYRHEILNTAFQTMPQLYPRQVSRFFRPPNPFTKGVSRPSTVDANFPDFDRPGKQRTLCNSDFSEIRFFPHCTQSCKCDYSYPYVQKFCNPPPLPMFLNTCRLWYAGCPKYERYHYASQFIYSKAEKGKKVELPLNSKPFSVVSPNGERIPVVVRQPGVNTIAKDTPIVPSDSVFSNAISQYGAFTDSGGVLHRPRSRSPFTKPGLWEANPDNPHNRDHANKYWYRPESVNIDWLSGQLAWGAHYAVPAAGVGGTDGFSTVHFPTIGTFLNIPDDYD
ncbi:unnamed protein product [Heligmosomoides polygyrus]|uniref:Uncharacterized protein n=1 Tax=Heligmosomoides polygyrus TaxID=6339 RepID=A0A183G4X6_HELPZ|nr:unnamed protein product [Heligmosomoides polygyrus]